MSSYATLALRLAGPMQSWGISSEFNRRATARMPSKSGVVGLLASAQGRQRGDDLQDLVDLEIGVRLDQPGRLEWDFHTVSDFRERPLLSAGVNAKGIQKPAGKKLKHVTRRQYIHDGVFVAFVRGQRAVIATLAQAINNPRYPLFLGRRSCPPNYPMILEQSHDELLWEQTLIEVVSGVPWQANEKTRRRMGGGEYVRLEAAVDFPGSPGNFIAQSRGAVVQVTSDVPQSFDPKRRVFASRSTEHLWVDVPTGNASGEGSQSHDPFALLGW